ncbi:MAG: DUF502 domain-containing protein [Planctomycetes bacterium]|nr:DUF502 domain-containing protein [Planctomycetota bacterium]
MTLPSPETEPSIESAPKARRQPRASRRLRSRFMAGLALVIPIWVTYVVVMFVFRAMRDASLWLLEAVLLSPLGQPLLVSWGLPSEQLAKEGLAALPLPVQWGIGCVAVLLTVAALYLLGMVTTNVVGRRIVRLVEAVVEAVPFVKVVYQASKQVLQSLAGEESQSFQRVVLVPFPNRITYSVGFVTRVLKDQRTGEMLYCVFVATTPNPTTGFVFIIRASDILEVDWSVEEAVKIIMSGGILMPDAISLPAPPAGGDGN